MSQTQTTPIESGLIRTSGILESNLKKSFATRAHGQRFSGPLSGPMSRKVESLRSAMPDTFNWGIYDDLHEKFNSNNSVRGGVVFKQTFKLVNAHPSCAKCHYGFEIDTYGRGCVHECAYCYAKDQLVSHGYWNRPRPFPVDLSEIRKIMHTVFETDKDSKWRHILEKRIPIRIGSMSDSFMWMDLKYGVTLEFLKILKFYRYPHVIFTRSDLVAHDRYLENMDGSLTAIQLSISGNNERLTKLIEPGAPSIQKRLGALKKLNENGIWATVRVNPLLPEFPDGYFTNKESLEIKFAGMQIPRLDLINDQFIAQLSDAGVRSFLAGFVRLSTWSVDRLSKSLAIDFRSFFNREQGQKFGDWIYSDREISFYYSRLKQQADKLGLRFSTCYIGNGEKDYFQYQGLWSNKSDCCDVVGNVGGFKKTCQSIVTPDGNGNITLNKGKDRFTHAPPVNEVQL